MITYNITQLPDTNAVYPAMVAAFSPSILTIEQGDITLASATLSVGTIWVETREAVRSSSKSSIKFDLQAIARAHFTQRDMFGDLSNQSSEDRRHDTIRFDFSVIYDAGDPPAVFSLSIPCFFGSYLVGQPLAPPIERVIAFELRGQTELYINLPNAVSGSTIDVINPAGSGNVEATIPFDSNRLVELLGDYPLYELRVNQAYDMDKLCNSVIHARSVYTEVRSSCDALFRYINSRGMVRYVGFKKLSESTKTKTSQGIQFDLYEQPIERDGSFVGSRLRLSTTAKEVKYAAASIADDYLPLFVEFTRASYVQMNTRNGDGSYTWRNVTIRDTSVTRKRKVNLTDVTVTIVEDVNNNPY